MQLITREFEIDQVALPDWAKEVSTNCKAKILIRKGFTMEDVKFVDGERSAIHIITSAHCDRDGEIILPKGISFKNYNANGKPVLWGHDYHSLPVGKNLWTKYDKATNSIIAKTQFAKHDKAEQIYQHMKEFPLSCSIGFIPKSSVDKFDFKKMDTKDWEISEEELNKASRVYIEAELLEYSIVPIPSNPQACQIAVAKGLLSPDDFESIGYIYEIIDPFKKEIEFILEGVEDGKQKENTEETKTEEESGTSSIEGEEKEVITKPDTENYIHIGLAEGGHTDHKIRTISISSDKGIKAHYCVDCKEITGYLFEIEKWTKEEAQKWVDDHKKDIVVFQVDDSIMAVQQTASSEELEVKAEDEEDMCECSCGYESKPDSEGSCGECPECGEMMKGCRKPKKKGESEDLLEGVQKPLEGEEPQSKSVKYRRLEIESNPEEVFKREYKERVNPNLSKIFDIASVPSQPSSYTYKIYCDFLECRVKDIFESSTFIPPSLMGTYLAAFKQSTKNFKHLDTRNIGWGCEYPPCYEVIQLNSKTNDDFLVDGSDFWNTNGIPIIMSFFPVWGGMECHIYTDRDNRDLNRKIIADAEEWIKTSHPLRNEKFSVNGEFIPVDKSDDWTTIILEDKISKTLERVCKAIVDKGDNMSNRGMLMVGSPGTGKTKACRIMMSQIDSTFVWASSKDFSRIGPVNGLKQAFSLARQLSPSILVMEDIDSWLDGYGVMDLLKTELDGIKKNKGVVSILTTNFPEKLPDALLDRPGRFHDVLEFGLPSDDIRKKMISQWIGDLSEDVLTDIIDRTKGFSGAHMWELIEFAKTISEDDEIDINDALLESLGKIQDQKQLIDRIRGKEVTIPIQVDNYDGFIVEIEDTPIEKSGEISNDFVIEDIMKAFNNVFKETIEPVTNIDKAIDEGIKRAQGKMF